jgi:hypothetical protein
MIEHMFTDAARSTRHRAPLTLKSANGMPTMSLASFSLRMGSLRMSDGAALF